MHTDRLVLERFFSHRARRPGQAQAALDALEPFYRKAEAGRYDLIYGPRLNVGEVCAALWTAADADAKGVVLTPTCVPVSDPAPWAEAKAPSLLERLQGRFAGPRATALPPTVSEELQVAFEAALGEPLRCALSRALAESPHVRQDAWDAVRYALSSYVVLALADNPATASLAPLLRVLEQAIPLSPLPGKPRIWCVLTG
jgi:hypothetical protein